MKLVRTPVLIMALSVGLFLLIAGLGWTTYIAQPSDQSFQSHPTVKTEDPYLLAVGDIASCGTTNDEAVAALATSQPGTIALLGDTVYDKGTAKEFAECFDPSWGSLKDRIRPAAGNHDYSTRGAVPYYAYFGSAAGEAGQGYYSYDLGEWHVIALNSNCESGGCQRSSEQLQWLENDLAAQTNKCTLAYFHHPRWSSGLHGSSKSMQPLWEILTAADVDVVLNGHDHMYERFAKLDNSGQVSPQGTREFVIGTGGRSLYAFRGIAAGSEYRAASDYGLLKMQLHQDGYSWNFLNVNGESMDTGSDQCH